MSCDGKFTVNRDMKNEFIITIKENGTLLPITIDVTDTFEFSLFELGTDTKVVTLDNVGTFSEGSVEVYDAGSGKIKITLEEAFVNTLNKESGAKADRYYIRPTYRISIKANTVANGLFVSVIDEVFVR